MSCLKNKSGDGIIHHSTINNNEGDTKGDNKFSKRTTKWVEEKRRQYDINNQSNNINKQINKDYLNKTWREKKSEKRKIKRQERQQANSQNKTNNTKKAKTTIQQYHDEEETWGDEMTLSKNWPQGDQQEREFTRIIHLNANGIAAENKFIEWETCLHSMDDIQADIFCLNETKIDTRQGEVRYEVHKIAKSKDRSMVIQMESSKQSPKKRLSIFKPGGTMIGIRGTKSGRILKLTNDKSKDSMGRWTIAHLKGKGNTIVSIISAYQVCKNGEKGEATAFLQQQADCYEKHKRVVNPRDQLCKDLQPVLQALIEKRNKVILCADMNDDAGMENNNQWNRMLRMLNMRNIHQELHQGCELPRTYIRGKRTLDMIAVSENISKDQIRCTGILPFHSLMASDHRPLYIDVYTDDLFGECQHDAIKHTFRRFTTKNVKKCEMYVNTLSTLMRKAKIGEKVNTMLKKVHSHLNKLQKKGVEIGNEMNEDAEARKEIEIEFQKLDTKRVQLMIAAEKSSGKARMMGMFWFSARLRKAAEALSNAKSELSKARNGDATEEDIQKLLDAKLKATESLRDAQREDRRYRDEMLDDLAEAKAKPWQMTKQQAAVIIKEAEKHSEIYKKINATVKQSSMGGIKSVWIPTSNNDAKSDK